MSDLLSGLLGNRRVPSPETLEKAHRLANTASLLLGLYLAALIAGVVWYGFNPFHQGYVPDILIGVTFVIAAVAFATWKVAAYRMVPDLSGAPAGRFPG